MSDSTRVAAVRSLFERWNKQEYDGICDNFAEDFLYQIDPEPVGVGSYTKPQQIAIESIHEVGDKITLKARDSVLHEKVGRSDHIFHAEAIFQGDKIQLLKVTIDVGSFSDKWQEYIKLMSTPQV